MVQVDAWLMHGDALVYGIGYYRLMHGLQIYW
jgi:hypothetical protein